VLSKELLSRWLLHSGALTTGRVTAIEIDADIETPISRLIFLKATYSDPHNDLPDRLVVKVQAPLGIVPDAGERELEFYATLAPQIGSPPLARCLAAIRRDEESSQGVLVLQDLRATHDHPSWPLPPSPSQSERAVDALARVHARWWESGELGRTLGEPHTVESLTRMVVGIAAHLPKFLESVGDAMSMSARRVFEQVFGSSLRPWLRLTNHHALTVTHGDAHSWNFLFPSAGDGPAILIDWQRWHVDVGARDLAFLIALHWYPSRRQELEAPLLRRYHEALQARGVAGYALDELWIDYRRSVVRNLTIPILFWSRGMKPEGWFHRLECAVAAYRDLACEELL
jgi:hypothetical protein